MAKAQNTATKAAANSQSPAGAGADNTTTTATTALDKIGRDTLAVNADLSAVYVTSDGTTFGAHCDAKNHGKTLTDTNVVTVEREKPNE